MFDLVVATQNPGKVAELRDLLVAIPSRVASLRDLGVDEAPPETGATFLANAISKAEFAARRLNMPALADDSGLCVEALGGRPGVQSARYGGAALTDSQRYALLLDELAGVPAGQRGACFECALALAVPGRPTVSVRGTLHGVIATEPSGAHGFGYDPIFFVPELGTTLGNVDKQVKNRISHRSRAVQSMLPYLQALGSQECTGDER